MASNEFTYKEISIERESYVAQRVQTDRRYKFGMWGVWSYNENKYIATGPKSEMNKIVKLLNQWGYSGVQSR